MKKEFKKSKRGRQYPVFRDRFDARDFKFEKLIKAVPTPVFVDLRGIFPSAYDQGQEGSCTGNGWIGFREYWQKKNNATPFIPLSRQALYYWERAMEGNVNEDAGAAVGDGAMVLNKIGACPEVDDPYLPQNMTVPPSAKAVADAAPYKIKTYYRVNGLNGIKQALAQGLPVVIGFDVYESFEDDTVAKTGIVPMPKRNEQCLGGHCVVIVGYVDTKKGLLGLNSQGYVIIRNSWGTSWGLNGYCQMDYKVLNKLMTDAWTGTL